MLRKEFEPFATWQSCELTPRRQARYFATHSIKKIAMLSLDTYFGISSERAYKRRRLVFISSSSTHLVSSLSHSLSMFRTYGPAAIVHAATRYLARTFVFRRIYILPNPETLNSGSGSRLSLLKLVIINMLLGPGIYKCNQAEKVLYTYEVFPCST